MSGSAPADRHRQAVYDLEDVAFGGTSYDEPMPFADAADLATSFCASGWWATMGLPVPAVVRTRRDSSRSYAVCDGDPTIHLAPVGCTVGTIAHELAHLLAARSSSDGAEPGHGPGFRRADVTLAGALMGDAAADRLAATFAGAGLPLGPPLDYPPADRGGFWTGWRAARALADARPAERPPIAL